ncbi:MAG: hypothetical protein J6564_04190, partial [Gilliamella sp.]|uniref:hypothetical protein n=1 Tax=Gilliamella sp. TaxID=1891236 RepID=UPI002600734C
KSNNKRGFSFVFHEIFESEHHQKQIGMLKEEIAITNESNKIKGLLKKRIKEIANLYPELQLNFNDMRILPTKIKKYLFAPPLILTEDNAIMLWDD